MLSAVSAVVLVFVLRRCYSGHGVCPDRPGHDRRYLPNSAKIRRELGWQPEVEFDEGIQRTVAWYVANEAWWRPLQARLGVVENRWGR